MIILTLTMLFLALRKFLRKAFRNTALLLMVTCGVGCSAEGFDSMGDVDSEDSGYITSFGEIFGEECRIVTDDGLTLYVEALGGTLSWDEVQSKSGRVLFNYSIAGNSIHENEFPVVLNRFYPLVEKRVEILEGASENGDVNRGVGPSNEGGFDVYSNPNFVSLLDGPAMPYEVGVGGGYININVLYYATTEGFVPEMSLVWDVATSNASTALFQLVGKSSEEMFSPTANLRTMWHTFYVGEDIAGRIEGVSRYAFFWRWWSDESALVKYLKEYTSIMTNPTLGGSSSRVLEVE